MKAETSTRPAWRSVSRGEPCGICGHASWCAISDDSTFATCRRVSAGGLAKTDKSGGNYYLHRLIGLSPATPSPAAPPKPQAERADPDTLHRGYAALLSRLTLSPAHRDRLLARGLDTETIGQNWYRTLPIAGRSRIARELFDKFGDSLAAVPGFVTRENERGKYVTIAGDAGLLVPVRDLDGRVVALKVRRDDAAEGEPRYRSISSTKYDGPGPGAPAHAPRGTPASAELVRVTEGELKADIVWHLDKAKVPTLSVPGAANWSPSLPLLERMGAKTVRIAYDSDAWVKPDVAASLKRFAEAIAARGLMLEMEVW